LLEEYAIATVPYGQLLLEQLTAGPGSESERGCLLVILHAAGQLDCTMGGPPIENDQENASLRRSLYFSIYPEDGGNMRFLETFDAPDPCDCYRRTESLVPQQALALTNSLTAISQSRVLARRLWSETMRGENGSLCKQRLIAAAFREVLSRNPSSDETTICEEFLDKQLGLLQSSAVPPQTASTDPIAAPAADLLLRATEALVNALFNHNEFVTLR
jgi:hypothetical protein